MEKYVNKIYAINNICAHPNVYTIPLGFGDRSLNRSWITYSQDNEYNQLDKSILLYMKF